MWDLKFLGGKVDDVFVLSCDAEKFLRCVSIYLQVYVASQLRTTTTSKLNKFHHFLTKNNMAFSEFLQSVL
jgi:phosphatidylinositol kinase/protein kinase (PI-3  family)